MPVLSTLPLQSMHYTNPETQRGQSRKRFYLQVYGLPVLLTALIGSVFYTAYLYEALSRSNIIYGGLLAFNAVIYVYARNRRNWLKMPDGSFHNLKEHPALYPLSSAEPSVYEAEYSNNPKSKILSLVTGLLMMGTGAWIGIYSGNKSNIFAFIGPVLWGAFLVIVGLKALIDKNPKLKIASNGLWTPKLGFVKWDAINYAEVISQNGDRHPLLYLEIRLKGTTFEAADQPDEKLPLNDLKNKEDIEMVINQSILDYNNYK